MIQRRSGRAAAVAQAAMRKVGLPPLMSQLSDYESAWKPPLFGTRPMAKASLQCYRLAERLTVPICDALKAKGFDKNSRTNRVSHRRLYFSGTKVKWI